MSVVALSELLGASVRDASGAVKGRVREIYNLDFLRPTWVLDDLLELRREGD